MGSETQKPWEQLSANALAWMALLGNFGPTVREADKTVKGYMLDNDGEGSSIYIDSGELRELSQACAEVADWLDARALLAARQEQPK